MNHSEKYLVKLYKKKINPVFYLKNPRRSLSAKQKKLIEINLKKYLFHKLEKKPKKVFLEIGSGYGENLINLAEKNKNSLILGCEVYKPAVAKLIEKIEEKNIKNILIFIDDIFILFKKIKKNSIEKIFLLFPDPWPKKKHHKRRLVSESLIKNFEYILTPKGQVYLSTDSNEYLKVIFDNFFCNDIFIWVNNKPNECFIRPKILARTKYENKADLNLNKKYFLKFEKKS